MESKLIVRPLGRRTYFVDEAGDAILFNKKKQIVLGSEGCSSFFMLGMIDVRDRHGLEAAMDRLAADLSADPYLMAVPSMRPEAGKTALQFHAKDDVPEVRREVFKLLMQFDVRFYAAVRDKRAVLTYVRQRNVQDASYRYHPNELYESVVRRLFSGRLHQNEQYSICFSRRGSSERTQALHQALCGARQDFRELTGASGDGEILVEPTWSRECRSLQATDYFLWALQRLYEKRESRYWEFLWPKVRCVIDIDETTRNPNGELYTQANPLTGSLRKN